MKEYVKPELFFESFELSEQIAVGCSQDLIVNHGDGESCVLENPAGALTTKLFVQDNANCTTYEFDGYCYHSGQEGFTVFSS